MTKFLGRIYSNKFMVRQDQIVGDIPSDKEVYKNAIEVAWPSAIEAVLVQLISSADLIMVGALGAAAISAVGITTQPRLILLAVIFSLNIGVTAVVARRKGEDNREDANKALRQSLVICGFLSLILSVLGIIYARPLIGFAGAQKEVVEIAVTYFRIICVGNFFTSLSLTINAAQRGAGNTRISMKTNIAANMVNLFFNFLLIKGHLGFPALGVTGAAIATAIGNTIGFLLSLKSITFAHEFLGLRKKQSWKLEKEIISSVLGISSSAFVEQVFMRVGFFTTNKLVAGLGMISYATHQICVNIMSISFAFGDGLGIAASALVGQSLGAKRSDLATIYGKSLQRIALTVGLIFVFIFLFGGSFLVSLFADDAAVIAAGATIMLTIAATAPIQSSNVVVGGILRGAGDTKFVAITSFLSIGLVRPGATWLFCYPLGFGLIGAWFAFGTDQVLRLFINYMRFLKGGWTKIKV
ncbi:MATE family efflux transporter [Sedimentibacter sp.]|uniref:MATE family efflux transporter n=1 Tax=Sedimentibacter sp. TaxID=1960295 RepID=UPI0028B0F947|nr:MATE family efflux transporter [Sedimentibacter sp.]